MERSLLLFRGDSTLPNKRLDVGCICIPVTGCIPDSSCNTPKWSMGLESGESWNGIILDSAAIDGVEILKRKLVEILNIIDWSDTL